MSTVRFNREVSGSVYLWWIVEPKDLGVLMGAISMNMMVLESYSLIVWTIVAFFIYLLAFRSGRPVGYDRHFFGHIKASKFLRPGRMRATWPFRESTQKEVVSKGKRG